jgi:Uma2 family endonuclease
MTTQNPASIHRIPLLENGDRLTRPEFERRYAAMPDVKKAELIEGIVYMPSPVRVNHHARPHARLVAWLSAYWTATPGTDLCIEPSIRLDLGNEPQPDAILRIEGGNSWIDQDDYIQGAPELVVEVAASSVSKDLNDKLRAYRRNRVQEYLVWKVEEQDVVWFALQAGEYIPLLPQPQGIVRSQVFPGLWLNTTALLQAELATVISALQSGLQSIECKAFRQQLAASEP